MPPELYRREKYSEVDRKLIKTVDMFGVAIVTYILFFGRHPFQEYTTLKRPRYEVDYRRQISADWVFPPTPIISE